MGGEQLRCESPALFILFVVIPPFLIKLSLSQPTSSCTSQSAPPPDLWRGSEQTAVGVLAATPHHRKGTLFTHVHLGLH